MQKTRFSIYSILFLLVFGMGTALGHSTSDKTKAKNFNDTNTVIELSHETIEGDETGKLLEDWKESLNFKKKVIEAIRVNNQFKQYSTSDILLDSLILFSLSHSLEVLSGPLAVNYGLANDWAPWLVYGAGIIGGIISVPGLDPLCIIIFATYKSSEHLRKGIKTIRMVVASPFKYAASKLDLKNWAKQFFVERSLIGELTVQKNFHSVYFDKDRASSVYEFNYAVNPFEAISVKVSPKNGHLSLVSLKLPKSLFEYGFDQYKLKTWLKDFGWNIRYFVLQNIEAYQKQQSIPYRSYIKKSNISSDWIELQLEDEVVRKNKSYKLRSCKLSFL
jgi:hypothetical protein